MSLIESAGREDRKYLACNRSHFQMSYVPVLVTIFFAREGVGVQDVEEEDGACSDCFETLVDALVDILPAALRCENKNKNKK